MKGKMKGKSRKRIGRIRRAAAGIGLSAAMLTAPAGGHAAGASQPQTDAHAAGALQPQTDTHGAGALQPRTSAHAAGALQPKTSARGLRRPVLLQAQNRKGTVILLKWKGDRAADSWRICARAGKKIKYFTVKDGSKTSLKIRKLSKKQTWSFRVQSCAETAAGMVRSPWSKAKKANFFTVVIDAGHQKKGNLNKEPVGPGSAARKYKVAYGTAGVRSRVPESRVTLKEAKCLAAQLRSRGYRVVMVRKKQNVNISNIQRAKIANRYRGGAVFVRLHCDASDSAGQTGFSMQAASGKNPYLTKKNIRESARLSAKIGRSYQKATGLKNHGIVYRDDLSGTNWCKIPTALIEMGFLTNPSDEKKLLSAGFQQRAARGIADGIDRYFGRKS